MYWHSPAKINSPITDNLFEQPRGEEVHGGKLAGAWDSAGSSCTDPGGAKASMDQLCFVEVEAAYWLRQRLGEMARSTW